MFSTEFNPLYRTLITTSPPQTTASRHVADQARGAPSASPQLDSIQKTQKAISQRDAPWLNKAIDALQAAGLSQGEATEIVLHGISAERATEMLNLKLVSPEVDQYPQALIAMHLLSKARAQGNISPQEVREAIEAFDKVVVVRPDGMIARALTGEPMERRAMKVTGGRLTAGSLVVGQAYAMRQGVLRELSPDLSEGYVVDELSLKHGLVDTVLDGAEAAVMAMVIGIAEQIAAFKDDPAKALEKLYHGLGQVPAKVVALVLNSPKLVEAFQRMTVDEQVKTISQLLMSGMMFAASTKLLGRSAASPGPRAAGSNGGGVAVSADGTLAWTYSVEEIVAAWETTLQAVRTTAGSTGRGAVGLAMVGLSASSAGGAMPTDNRAVRRDDAPYSAKPPKRKGVKAKKLPDRKSHINEQGDLVPANPRGKTTLAEHVIGDEKKKASSPYTSMSAPGGDKRYFGDTQIKIDLDGLVKSGANVEIFKTDEIISILNKEMNKLSGQLGRAKKQGNSKMTQYLQKKLKRIERAIEDVGQNHEILVKGVIPARFVEVVD